MYHILFVDDEPRVLRGMRRQLQILLEECVMVSAESGPAALRILSESDTRFDAIITDIRMSGMDGIALLKQVQQLYPYMVRIVLTGHVERDSAIRSIGLAHQFLSKPCSAETLHLTIKNALDLRNLLTARQLKQLVARLDTLPSLPALYNQLLEEIYQRDASIGKISQIIAQDIGMTAKILQLVNSAFFGLRRQISDPAQAVVYLGLDTMKSLVLSVSVFEQLDAVSLDGTSLAQLQAHSLSVATLARQIAQAEQMERQVIDFAFTAGLLHEVGRLILITKLPQDYARVHKFMAAGIPLLHAEGLVFHATHAQVGAYLLGIWGLPYQVVEAVAHLHNPSVVSTQSGQFTALTAVHVANVLLHQQTAGAQINSMPQIDESYLTQLNYHGKLEQWRALVEKGGVVDGVGQQPG